MNIAPIIAKLKLDSKEFSTGLSDAERALVGFSAATAAMSTAVLAAAQATANYYDEQIKASRAAGIAVEQYSALTTAAEFSGVTQEQVTKALSILAVMTDETARKLGAFGIAVRDENGELKDNGDLLREIADRLQSMEQPSDRAALAVAAFGEEGTRMVNLLQGGSEGLDAFAEKAEKLGRVVREDAAVAAELYNDNLTELRLSLKGLVDSTVEAFIIFANETGLIQSLSETVQGAIAYIRGMDESTKNLAVSIGASVAVVGSFSGAAVGLVKALSVGSNALDGFKTALRLVGIQANTTFAALAPLIALQTIAITITIFQEYRAEQADRRFNESVEKKKKILKELSEDQQKAYAEALGQLEQTYAEYEKALEQGDRTTANRLRTQLEQLGTAIYYITGQSEAFVDTLKNINTDKIKELKTSLQEAGDEAERLTDMPKTLVTFEPKAVTDLQKEVKTASQDIVGSLNDVFSVNVQRYQELQRELKEIQERFEKSGKTAEDEAQRIGAMIAAYGSAALDYAQQAVDAILDITGGLGEATLNGIQHQQELLSLFLDVALSRLEKAKEAEIAAYERAEQAKVEALRSGSVERLALMDEEFQREKELAELRLEEEKERARISYEQKLLTLEEEYASERQRLLALTTMRADWQAYIEKLEQEHQANLADLADEFSERKLLVEQETESSIVATQEQAAAEKAAIEEKYEKQQEALKKAGAFLQYQMDVAAFRLNKQMMLQEAIAQAGMVASYLALGIAQSFATGGLFGAAAGTAIAAGIAGLVAAGLAQSIATISALQPPPPPAELFMREGGLIQGPSHENGGVPVRAEGGEFIIDKDRTEQLYNFIDRATAEAGRREKSSIIFQEGAFQIHIQGNVDDRMLDTIADKLQDRINRRLY